MLKFIENIGDYFATNYFDEDFAKKVFEKSGYTSEDIKSFNKVISPLKDKYYKYKNEYITLKRAKDRIKLTNQFHTEVLNALKYDGNHNDYAELCILNGNEGIPVRSKLYRGNKPHMFVMEMQSVIQEGDQPAAGLFDQVYHQNQWDYIFKITDPELKLSPSIINEALSELFLIEQERRPLYVMMLAGSEIYLIQYEKWFRGSYLRFSLEDLFDETSINRDYYALFYFMLAKETLAPDSDIVLMEQLDEDSHKSAYAVTQDLKEGVIKAIEDLANESVYYLKSENKLNTLDEQFANNLKDDCLTLVYRLLFLFYAESRPELEILPMNDEVYEKGYSLEMLRDLEQVPLQSESAKNGFFFHDSLWHLFLLVGQGYNEGDKNTKSFIVKHIDSPLFDDRRLHVLQEVKFRNYIWQEIIQYLSLSKKQRGRARGRISYVNLGINQLGSVYEGLLSYRGYFANEDQIEVKKANDLTGKEGTYVVPRSRRGNFEEAEILKDEENPEQDKIIPPGSFIYRLSGRDRQKSASYYTPEVLTHTTVKYTLKPILERLEKGEIKADDLLKLKILEPAMGAAAFHNEVINQLSEAYLNWKQKEKKKKVQPNAWREELQRVKAFIATQNVYGVDINPTAVELGKISLWLNVIHKDMATPFFGYRLGVGNAVVGAWRKVYTKDDVLIKYTNPNRTRWERREWWTKAPRQIPWSGKGSIRKENEIYHFLLPEKNIVPSANIRMLKDEYPSQARKASDWKRDFIRPLTSDEFVVLQKISGQIDRLFGDLYKQQSEINEATQSHISVWGQEDQQRELFDYRKKERLAEVRDETNAAYYKLKMIMDYWCSLWFWDMRQAKHLPNREDYISDLLNILDFDLEKALQAENTKGEKEDIFAPIAEQAAMPFIDNGQQRLKTYKSSDEKQHVGEVIARYAKQSGMFPDRRKQLIQKYAKQYGFFHYELEFVEVFKERGGFDVIVGNPPWIKVTFEEKNIIGDEFPEVFVRKLKAPQIASMREDFIKSRFQRLNYIAENLETDCLANYMNSIQIYPLLFGQQTDLYRSILSLTLSITKLNGVLGLINPDSVYDDPNGQIFRRILYSRLYYLFEFKNELKLFPIDHHNSYCINVYSGSKKDVSFDVVNNLFHPSTITNSYVHSGHGICEGIKIKDEVKDKYVWNTKPHLNRILNYTDNELSLISRTFEDSQDLTAPRLVAIHTKSLLKVLDKIGNFKFRVHQFENKITVGWDETNAVDVLIERKTYFPLYKNFELIYSGPHFFVSNPYYKTAKAVCVKNADYENIYLNKLDEEFLPRVNYKPIVNKESFSQIIKGLYDANKEEYDEWINYYKLAFSKMLSITGERTLQPAIIPPKSSHINGVISIIFRDTKKLLELTGLTSSIVMDYFVKSIGSGNLTDGKIKYFPLGIENRYFDELAIRVLRLNCLSKYYKALWQENFSNFFKKITWSKNDNRLSSNNELTKPWCTKIPLKNFYERRMALIEIDVIVSIALGLSFDELISIYTIQFPVLRNYEDFTYYDSKGNIIFTNNSQGLKGIGLDKHAFVSVKDNKEGQLVKHTITNSEMYLGKEITYYPPFEKCDRVEDYKQAWSHFEKVFMEK